MMKSDNPATVLLADYGKPVHAVADSLKSAGFKVLRACSAKTALEVAEQSPDLALIDFRLPDVNSIELCKELKASPSSSHLPIVVFSSRHMTRAEILQCFECGADDYFLFPIPEEELLARVSARIRRRSMDARWTNRLLQQQASASQTRIARLKAALEIAQLGIWELTAQVGIWEGEPSSVALQFDGRCRNLLGIHDEGSITLERLLSLLHPEDRNRVQEQLHVAMGMYGSGVLEAECRIIRPDGTDRWVAIRAHEVKSEITDAKTIRLVGTLMDITDRKHTIELLIRSERVAALGRMAATLAHEINNPLAAVVNALYLARSVRHNPAELARYLDVAEDQVKQVTHITRQALGFYREPTKVMPIAVGAVVKETISLLRSRIKSKRVVQEGVDDDRLRVVGVSGEIRQVLSNLVANSLEAIADDGSVRVRVSRFPVAQNGISRIRISVADNGKGIPVSAKKQLFEPLFTTKGVGGTGLGLWVSKQIVEKHGGSILIRSSTAPGRQGTVFSIILPAAPPGSSPSSTTTGPVAA